jgi:hypothetical protein
LPNWRAGTTLARERARFRDCDVMTESEKLDTPNRKTFRFYMPLTPVREHYSDNGSTVLLQTPVRGSDGRIFEVALIGSSHDLLMVRISMFELEENPPPEDIPKIDAVAERNCSPPPVGQNAIISAMPTDPVAGERVGRHGAIEPSR